MGNYLYQITCPDVDGSNIAKSFMADDSGADVAQKRMSTLEKLIEDHLEKLEAHEYKLKDDIRRYGSTWGSTTINEYKMQISSLRKKQKLLTTMRRQLLKEQDQMFGAFFFDMYRTTVKESQKTYKHLLSESKYNKFKDQQIKVEQLMEQGKDIFESLGDVDMVEDIIDQDELDKEFEDIMNGKMDNDELIPRTNDMVRNVELVEKVQIDDLLDMSQVEL